MFDKNGLKIYESECKSIFNSNELFYNETMLKEGERIVGFRSRNGCYAFHIDFQFIIGKME